MVSPLVSYDWEYKHYPSKIIAKHVPSGNVAWLIKPNPSQLLVRLTHGRNRSLIKDLNGDFLTLDFSQYVKPILAILGSDGVLKIFHINFIRGTNDLLFTFDLHENIISLTHCLLEWGPKSKLSENGMDISLLLVAAVNKKVFLFDLNGVVENLDQSDQGCIESLNRYRAKPRLLGSMVNLTFFEHDVEAVTFSADASTLFISADLGNIFAFDLSDVDPLSFRPFKSWSTETYSPLFALHYGNFEGNRYIIGGTGSCRELRLWQLPKFKLLQTIRFCSNEEKGSLEENKKRSPSPVLISQFDQESGLLFISDIKRTVLYTLMLARNPDNPEVLRFQCLCEFPLVAPCIAFNLNNVTRSHSFDKPLSDSALAESDNIVADLLLIHPKTLAAGKLSFFVPLEAYKQKDLNNSQEFSTSEELVLNSSSPVFSPTPPEEMDVFSRLLNIRPKSESSNPIHHKLQGDGENGVFSSSPSENPPSVGSSTPKVTLEGEVSLTSKTEMGASPNSRQEGVEGSAVFGGGDLSKVFDSAPSNIDSPSLISVYPHATSPNLQENLPQIPSTSSAPTADPSRTSFAGFGGVYKTPVLSDSTCSLAGSSSVASLSNSLRHNSSANNFICPPNDNQNRAIGLSMKNVLSDSTRSLDGYSVDTNVPQSQVGSPISKVQHQKQRGSTSAFSLDESLSGGSGDNNGDLTQLLKSVFRQNKEILSSIKTLTNKVLENKNNLAKLSNDQKIILKQVNSLTTVAPGTPVCPVASSTTPPPWANQILDHVRKQKAESAKQLSQLETAVKNLQLTATTNSPVDVVMGPHSLAPPTPSLDNKKIVEQVRGAVRNELHNLFQANTPKIVDPVIQNLRENLERILSPLPQIVADRMLTVIKEPKFVQYIADQMSGSLSPVVAEGYRNELRQTLVPGLNNVVDKLCKDLNDLVQGAMNRHIQTVTMRIESGVQSTCNKMDSSTKKFDDQIKNLSKDISGKVAGRVSEVLNKALQQHQTKVQQVQPEPLFPTNSLINTGLGHASTIPPLIPPQNPQPQQQLKNISTGSNTAIENALNFIQSGQYPQALETALTSPDQAVLLQVLPKIPVVSLFDQNIRQEILLSLIHQLSCGNLQDQLEMKLSFLQEAVCHLRVNDSTVREMGGGILTGLSNKLAILRMSIKLNTAQENRFVILQRSLSEKQMALMH
nr:enhancer of mRNA decapping protein 4 [Hymenolepis microstoma]